MKPKQQGLTIDIQLSELAGYEFYMDGKKNKLGRYEPGTTD